MALKMEHRILNAPSEPKTGFVYRARVASVSIEGNVVVVSYTIYTPKNRKPGKPGPVNVQVGDLT